MTSSRRAQGDSPSERCSESKRGGSRQWMTYAQFREETDRVRAGLATLGVDKATASRRNVVLDRYAQEVEGLYG